MNKTQYFAHRPPTNGIHLLSDPFPVRLNGSTSLFNRAENLAVQREHFAVARRFQSQTKEIK